MNRCVVSKGRYITLVALDPDGKPMCWELKDDEELVDIAPPIVRNEYERTGFLKPVLSGGAWVEGATGDELAKWEREHPAPAVPPTEMDVLKSQVTYTAMRTGTLIPAPKAKEARA